MATLFDDIATPTPKAFTDWYNNFRGLLKKIDTNEAISGTAKTVKTISRDELTTSDKDIQKRALRDQYVSAEKNLIDHNFKVYED